jgi:hypothetical protein
VSVVPFGDAKAVTSAKIALSTAGFKAIAVRDGDQGDNKSEGIFKLPGKLAPELEIFSDKTVQELLLSNYNIDFDSIKLQIQMQITINMRLYAAKRHKYLARYLNQIAFERF